MTQNSTNKTQPCSQIQDLWPDIVDKLEVQAVFGCFYAIIWFLGVCGNLIVIYIAGYKRLSFTVRTVFILNLALADLFIACTSLPMTSVMIFSRKFLFPPILCYSISMSQGWAVMVSSFTLVAIAIDRYCLIVHPTKEFVNYRRAKCVVFFIWLFSGLATLPLFIYTKVIDGKSTSNEVCGYFCAEDWPSSNSTDYKTVYGTTISLTQFCLPLIICSACYIAIGRKLQQQIETRQMAQTAMLPEAERRRNKRRSRTNRMMIAMVASFCLAWLPLNTINWTYDLGIEWIPTRQYQVIFAVAHVSAMTQIIWNPIIYSWFNASFRKAVLSKVSGVRRKFSSYDGDPTTAVELTLRGRSVRLA